MEGGGGEKERNKKGRSQKMNTHTMHRYLVNIKKERKGM